MLRLPQFELAAPTSVEEAVRLLAEWGEKAMPIAGGTDLLPNLKHGLFAPQVVVSLAEVEELNTFRVEDDMLVLGAMTKLDTLATDARIGQYAPALAQAAGLVAGPQLRRMGTLGGNVMLDTRCQWYNQTHFWRQSLGYCLKKDGTECHVVAGGKKCVAAASNDTAPALMTLGATLVFQGPAGRRELLIADLWRADGIYNKKVTGELLVEIRIPAQSAGHRGAYGKLRDRGSIDFPLLGLAVRLDLDDDGAARELDLCAVALQAKPTRVKGVCELIQGKKPGDAGFDEALEAVGRAAYKQCRPLANVPGDHDYRREMVPVYVRRTVRAAFDGSGPVHHI